jgi:LysR family glycine cleavage system transcriptional activator
MRMPPLNALRAFEAAARHNSFLRAAEELHVTPGAVSRHVKHLEEELGVALFRRLPRGIELTEQGRKFLPALTDAFASITQAARQVAASKGELRLICPVSFSVRWLIPRLEKFREAHPEVPLQLTTANYEWDEFYSGNFDLGFDCGEPNRPEGIEVVRILPELITPVCAPTLLEKGPTLSKPEDLADFKLLHTTADRRDWRVWLEAFEVTGVDPLSGEIFPTLDTAVQAALLGQGITMGDMVLVRGELEAGKLVCPFPDHVLTTDWEGMCLYGLAGCWQDPRVEAFKTWLLETAAAEGLLDPTEICAKA